ncbi:hypothetical protein N206_07760 [Helicobacter pylori UM111]|nr:hypothetical protein N206_07760 [Helicobacter pylori UM111]
MKFNPEEELLNTLEESKNAEIIFDIERTYNND